MRRSEEGHVLGRMVQGKSRRVRQKTRWKDLCNRDMESFGLKEEDVMDRTKRKRDLYKIIPAIPDDGKNVRRRITNERHSFTSNGLAAIVTYLHRRGDGARLDPAKQRVYDLHDSDR